MQYAILKRAAVFCFQSDLDESEIKSLNSTLLKQSSVFFETFPSLEDRKAPTANECVTQ